MSHELKADEIAIVLRPEGYEGGEWEGDVAVGLAIAKDTPIPPEVQTYIVSLATLMSCFLDVCNDHPDVYDLVEERRNLLMGIADPVEDKLDIEQEGNVYTLSRWTKTEGSA